MTVPLARDQDGTPFDLPPEAAYWRVRRQTGGRPSTVLGPDGEPLFVMLTCDRAELRSYGCSGSIRLEAVDESYKPVHSPVAFVELGDEAAQRPAPATDHGDLVRSSVESLTRTMEAMQRAQVERERTLAQKERALTDAQVARDRMFTDLLIALLERSGGGKPQDPVAALKQQLAFQRALEQETGRRNAGMLPAPVAEADDEKMPAWVKSALPFVPVVATGVQELVVKSVAKDDPFKAERLRRDFKKWAQITAQMAGGAPAEQPVAAVDGPEPRPRVARPLRQLMAQLDDDEASTFGELLDRLDAGEHARLGEYVESLGSADARIAWARGLLRGEGPNQLAGDEPAGVGNPSTAGALDGIGEVPPQLVPVLMQLSEEDRIAGLQIVAALDRETIARLTERLSAMPPDRALMTIRKAIDDARRRNPSVAHRAIAAALREEEASRANGVASGGAS